MCLILLAYRTHPEFPLIVAANRDEYYERPTRSAHFWQDWPDIFAGRDLQAGGTWMGISTRGRFAAVTNFREPGGPPDNAISRGSLCSRFLQSDVDIDAYLEDLSPRRHRYAGFNLLIGDFSDLAQPRLVYFSNRLADGGGPLSPGIHGICNGLLDENWPKVAAGKDALAGGLGNAPSQLLGILLDTQTADTGELPDTGIDKSLEKALSSRFISMENYGTRCATVLRIDRRGRVEWLEQNFGPSGRPGEQQQAVFVIAGR